MGYGQTGVLVAEILGLPHASLILQVEKTADGLTVKRELEEGWFQSIEIPTPCLLTIQSGGSKLRYATLMGIKRAKGKELRSIPASDLGTPADPVAFLQSVSLVRKKQTTQFLTGTPAQSAAALVEKLQFEARVL
jgi:electron transfer flavoprotein beta subunit